MIMPGRNFNADKYRFGFNGQEKDDEIKGGGNQYDYGFRIYDPRLVRFLSVDPLTKSYPELTPYQFASNSPIWAIDLDGLEAKVYTETVKTGHAFISVGKADEIVVYTYGRYAGTYEEWHGINSLSNGPGVLVKLTGDNAQQYIRSKLNLDDASAFEITDVKEGDVSAYFDNLFNSSSVIPDKGEFKGNENARVIDDYKVLSNNCTTKSSDALNQAGSKALEETEYPNAATGTPEKQTFVIPASLQSKLKSESKKTDSPVKDVTKETKKEINNSTNGGAGGNW